MSEELSLITLDFASRKALATDAVAVLRDAALEQSALIGKVTNAAQQEEAVKAQTALHRYLKLIDKAEEASKKPLNELRGEIKALADQLRAEADAEGMRVAGLIGEFQEFERIRVNAERKAQRDELDKIERERAAAVAQAPTLEAQEEVNDRYSRLAAGTVQTIEPARASGQVIKPDWEVTVTDVHLLYRAHPNCVKLEPRISEIKNLLALNIPVQGITAKQVINAGVRLKPERKAIEA